MSVSTMNEDMEFAIHSNIPPCCAAFWIEQFAVRSPEERDNYRGHMARHGWAGEYIPCPSCMVSGQHTELHVCDFRIAECARFEHLLEDRA